PAVWRRLDPRPELIVLSASPETLDLAIRIGGHAVAAPSTPEAVAAVVGGLETRAREDEAAARLAAARDLDIVQIREALRPRMNQYVAAAALARPRAGRGAPSGGGAGLAPRRRGARTARGAGHAL